MEHMRAQLAVGVLLSMAGVLLVANPASAAPTTCGGLEVTIYAADAAVSAFPSPSALRNAYKDEMRAANAPDFEFKADQYKEHLKHARSQIQRARGPVPDEHAAQDEPYVNIPIVLGTPGDDVILGTQGAEWIFGLGGNDVICGRSGNDVLNGGAGADELYGGGGHDWLTFGSQRGFADEFKDTTPGVVDILDGGAGNDWIFAAEDDKQNLVSVVIPGSEPGEKNKTETLSDHVDPNDPNHEHLNCIWIG